VRVVNERHAREERLAHLAQFDSLTGEMNRAQFIETLGTALEEAIRFRASCGLLVVAIDYLQRVNDAYGFEVADALIAALAQRLRTRMRGGDSLGGCRETNSVSCCATARPTIWRRRPSGCLPPRART
jgi:GGDEF domain-containing protein